MGEQVYRQLAHRLKIPAKTGGEHKVSERPSVDRKGTRVYLDSVEKPTLVTISDGDAVDVEFLLRTGAIVPYKAPRAGKGVKADGEESIEGNADLG